MLGLNYVDLKKLQAINVSFSLKGGCKRNNNIIKSLF